MEKKYIMKINVIKALDLSDDKNDEIILQDKIDQEDNAAVDNDEDIMKI